MFKSINRVAVTTLFLIALTGQTVAQSLPLTIPIPQSRPAAAPVAPTSLTPAPVQLLPQAPQPAASAGSQALAVLPISLSALPKTKPGLPPLSTAVPSSAQPPSQNAAPTVQAILPAVSRAENGIEARSGSLKQALDALSQNKQKTALAIHKGMKQSLDRVILTYILAIGGYHDLPAAEIKAFYDRKPQWPSRSLIARRVEEAVVRETPSGRALAKAFGNTVPNSTTAAIEVAISHLKAGNKNQATKIIRPIWRDEGLNAKLESRILSNLRSVLTNADHFRRASYLLYRERATAALRLKKYLSSAQYKLVDARVSVIRGQKTAGSKLDSVPSSLRKDPGYIFSRVQYLRRKGRVTQAADLLIKAPRDVERLINHREWWVERRLMSRIMLNNGDARRAYKIAATHTAQSSKDYSEAEFHAGFFALRYLKDHKTAAVHFEKSWKKASRDRDKARGLYWQGRAWEAAGDRSVAAKFYQAAANPTVYYGQLALEELGQTSLVLHHPPAANAALQKQFNGRELVQAIKRLKAVGHSKRSSPILRHLGRTLQNPSEVALAHELAQSLSLHQEAVQIGQLAQMRGLPADKMAFPLNVIPRSVKTNGVDIAVIYALTKQESVFNIQAVSSANARGLMQMLPATAKTTAKKLGLRYSKAKLTSDPAYAVRLGSAFLKQNLEKFNGSYILTFAAYNAGPGRPPQWIERFGDPRSSRVNAIDWVERIPFTETRDYVMKLIENLQVYEARIHGKKLDISKDLKRGKP
ncbi:transglycosylase SLT domain-containing protein [Cohaesibacter celericrescens]|uniref:Lytic transglycosylase n=1 Tax=Cohaesibacter celericrescens TaxID=2067669 RepID=A0A2N5XW81_9HYPH|nr:transglycosylase SLT domain-containing protein [Cohaesibacter celericrescens]PLW78688.1 lytic transglycosylase [Cohaesibacter celericrescens]